MKKVFTKYLFLLLISLFALGFILANLFGEVQYYGINKTVGWAYSIQDESLIALIFGLSQIIYIIGYFILFLLGRKTNYYLSIAHFELIIVTLAITTYGNVMITTIFCFLSIILFFVNIFKSHK
jgi:hypothetical protein